MSTGSSTTAGDPLAALEALLPALPRALERQKLGVELKRVEAQIATHRPFIERFFRLTDTLGTLHDAPHSTAREAVAEALFEVGEFGTKLATVESKEDLRAVTHGFDGLRGRVASMEGGARLLWSELYRREMEPLGLVGSVLRGIADTADLAERLCALSESARRLCERQQSAIEDFATTAGALRAEAAALKAEVNALATDPEVDAFLQALAGGRATLRLATANVLRWLEQLEALDRFDVRPRA